jgi:hypothetical protein
MLMNTGVATFGTNAKFILGRFIGIRKLMSPCVFRLLTTVVLTLMSVYAALDSSCLSTNIYSHA